MNCFNTKQIHKLEYIEKHIKFIFGAMCPMCLCGSKKNIDYV